MDTNFEQLSDEAIRHNNIIMDFEQYEDETLDEAWSRLNCLLRFYFENTMTNEQVLYILFYGIKNNLREMLNYVSGRFFLNNSPYESLRILNEKLYLNNPDTYFYQNEQNSNYQNAYPDFENSDVFQENFFSENLTVSQENLWANNFENTSNFCQNDLWCEDFDQNQNCFYQESHDFSPVNSDTWFNNQSSSFSQENFCSKKSKSLSSHSENDSLKEMILKFMEKTEREIKEMEADLDKMKNTFTNQFVDSPIQEPHYNDNYGLYCYNTNDAGETDSKFVENCYDDYDSEYDEILEKRNLVPEPVGDDLTDEETTDEEDEFELEPMEGDDAIAEEENVSIVPELIKDDIVEEQENEELNTDKFSNGNNFNDKLQEFFNSDVGKRISEEITIDELDAFLDMDIDQISQYIDKPHSSVTIPIESTIQILPLTVFTDAQLVNNKRKLEEAFATFPNLKRRVESNELVTNQIPQLEESFEKFNFNIGVVTQVKFKIFQLSSYRPTNVISKRKPENLRGLKESFDKLKFMILKSYLGKIFNTNFKEPRDIFHDEFEIKSNLYYKHFSNNHFESQSFTSNEYDYYYSFTGNKKFKSMVYHVPRPPDYFKSIIYNLWYNLCKNRLRTLIAVGTRYCQSLLNSSMGGKLLDPDK